MKRTLATLAVVVIACGGPSGSGSDAGVDASTDGQPPPSDGGDSGPLPTPPACTTLATLPVRTPTVFVDFAGGSDANDGKSQQSAFKHAPGDANATGNAKSKTLAAGDVVLLKGGVEYDGTITIATSGTAPSPIVLEGGAQQSWGTGKAIIDGQTTRNLGIAVTGASNVIVEGFEVRNFDKSQGSTGISVDGGNSDTVVGNQLHDIYYAKIPAARRGSSSAARASRSTTHPARTSTPISSATAATRGSR